MHTAAKPTPAALRDAVIVTHELDTRPSRAPQHALENQALLGLMDALAAAPDSILERLAATITELCRAGSAGISLLEPGDGDPAYRWRAVSGALAAGADRGPQPHRLTSWVIELGGSRPQLFRRPARLFAELDALRPRAEEILMMPLAVDARVIGSVWAVHHRAEAQFDREDARLLERLARFAAVAWRLHESAFALREQQTQTSLALEATGVGVFRYDLRTGHQVFSQRLLAIWGLGAGEEPTPERIRGLVHPDDRDALAAVTASLDPNGPGRFALEHRIVRPDGELRWVQAQGQTEFEDEGGTRRARRCVGTMRDVTDRHLVQEELARREAQLELATRIVGAGVFDHDYARGSLYWSPRLREIHELPADATPSLEVLDAQLLPEDRPAHMAAIAALADPASNGAFTSEYRIRRRDGEVRWILARAQTWFEGAGAQRRRRRTLGVEQDITDQKRIEAALRESEQRFVALADSVPVLAWTTTAAGDCDYLNKRWYEYTGQTPQHATGTGWYDAVHPEDRGPISRLWERSLRSGEPLEAEYRLRRHDGAYRWFSARASAQRAADGRIDRWFGTSSDVDEIRRLVIASENVAQRLRLATDAAQLGILEYFIDGRRHWDERARALWGIGPDEPITHELFMSRVHPEDRALVEASIERVLDPQRSSGRYEAEYRVTDRAGRERWVHATGNVRFRDGRPAHVIGTVQDVTGQKAIEAALRVADRRKDEFLATLAHELRNPLAPIRNAARILASPKLDDAALHWSRQVIQRQVTHMAWLLDDLLDVARITQGKLELRRERIALSAVIETAVEAARPLIDGKRHVLAIELPERDIEIDADPLRLAQVVSNLLTNAAKYTDAGGRIAVIARLAPPNLLITVRDSGIGISPEALRSIFEMFSQVADSLSRSEGGLGIGLALVKGLVELHGGSIEARSAGPGRGSEFTVHLPLPHDAVDGGQDAQAGKMPAQPHGRRVLIADDNQDSADSLGMILELAGHQVRVAHGGHQALQLAAEFHPDAVLLDIGMPDLNGYETARALRAAPGGADLELIALTGWGHPDDKRRAAEAGFDRHLTKPVDPAELEELLRVADFNVRDKP